MSGDYNTIQKNLLLAGDYAQQAQRRLEYVQAADKRQQVPQLRHSELPDLLNTARKLADDVQALLKKYDAGQFENSELPF